MLVQLAAILTMSIVIPTVTAREAAQSANDVQCALASNRVATDSKDPKQKQVARDMYHFYLGRIDGRLSEEQLESEVAIARQAITASNINSTLQTCFVVAQRKLKAIQNMAR
jgi:hypothetical protein